MADVVTEPQVEEPSAAPREEGRERRPPPNWDEPLPPYDDSLLVKVKGKVKRPSKPDDTERNTAVEELQAEIKRRSERIAEIKGLLQGRRNRTADPAAEAHKRNKTALRGEWDAVLKQKMQLKEDRDRCNTEKEVVRNNLREMRSKIPRGSKLETLEEDLAALEYKLAHESLSASDEKRAQQQLSQLNAARPLAREGVALEEKLKACEAARTDIRARIDKCDAVLDSIKQKETVENTALDSIRAKRDADDVDIPALEVEKQECWEIIQLLRKQMDEVRTNFNKQWQEFKKLQENHNIYMRHVKKAEYEERKAHRESREAEAAGEAPAEGASAGEARGGGGGIAMPEPFESEIYTIDQLLTYLRKFTATEGPAAEEEAKGPVEVPQGLRAFKKKDADEDLSFFTSQHGSKGKGKKKGGKAPAAASEPAKKKVTHTIELLKTFMQLRLDVPNTTADIPAAIEAAVAKRAEFLEKRKQAKEAPPRKAPVASSSKDVPPPDAAMEAETNGTPDADANGAEDTEAGAVDVNMDDATADDATAELSAGPERSNKSVGLTVEADELTTSVSIKLDVAE